MDRKADLYIAQALAIGQLGEGHGPVLLGAGERSHPTVAVVALDDPGEGRPRQKIHELGEQGLAGVHGTSTERPRKVLHQVQIDTNHFSPETRTKRGISGIASSVNRTAVNNDENYKNN